MTNRSADIAQLPSGRRLWFAFLGGALAWAVHIGARYPLVEVACNSGLGVWVLHAVTALCLGVALAAGVVSWRLCERLETADHFPLRRRSLFMARSGIFLSALFAFIIVLEAMPAFMVDPCK